MAFDYDVLTVSPQQLQSYQVIELFRFSKISQTKSTREKAARAKVSLLSQRHRTLLKR